MGKTAPCCRPERQWRPLLIEKQGSLLYNAPMEKPQAKNLIITIAGRPGAGKSTTSKAVAATLGYDHFSSGDLFRAIGKERGLDVFHTNEAAYKDKEIDQIVDGKLREIGQSGSKLVIDSRTAWHWIQQSFKVFLDLDLEVAAQRIIDNTDAERRASEHIPDDPKQYAEALQRRLDSESNRYRQTYNIDPYAMTNYDLVVDTGVNNPEQAASKIIAAYQKWLGNPSL